MSSNAVNYKSKKLVFRSCDGMPASPELLGGKGAGLVELARLGLPVPPNFIISTAVARAFAQHEKLPVRLDHQLGWGIAALEKETGRVFAGHENPLLVSVRSGAAVSMPGMMDTVLNLGLNRKIADGFASAQISALPSTAIAASFPCSAPSSWVWNALNSRLFSLW